MRSHSSAAEQLHMTTPAMPPGLKYAWYGDDFTGASDTLATLAEAGLKALLFLDVPTAAQLLKASSPDAIGIAGAARSMTSEQMRHALAPVAHFFRACGAPVVHYKCCSTFDSAPQTGSIGEAVSLLNRELGERPAIIIGGQPSLGRYCAFGQLFAAAEANGPVYRIDRHPTMSRHPVTPMTEADLKLHLERQGLAPITSFDLRAYESAPENLGVALEARLANSQAQAVLMDVVRESQLGVIGGLIWQRALQAVQLCVGASSVAQALLDYWAIPRVMHSGQVAPASGPVLVLAGSMSPLTARQITAARCYQRLTLDPRRLANSDAAYADNVELQIISALRSGRHVLAHTSPLPGQENAFAAARGNTKGLARACGRLLRRVLENTSVSRVGVAGGDTSSHAIQALEPTALEWLGRPAAGVALCRVHAEAGWLDGMEVMLKGGQMGEIDLFDKLVNGTN